MTALAAVEEAPGLDAYMAALEDRLRESVASHPGTVADAGAQALAAGGKRLRPLLVFLTARDGRDPVPAGAAVELVHMASLVHDDMIDRAALRRGHETAWRTHGSVGARTTGDYLYARAFSELSATGDEEGVQLLAAAALVVAAITLAEVLARAFDAFFTTKSKGMGMGLAICRSIIDRHDGTLSVSPGAPYGSVFRVVLPGSG
jgi:octaprenyl-diphosphate synthase